MLSPSRLLSVAFHGLRPHTVVVATISVLVVLSSSPARAQTRADSAAALFGRGWRQYQAQQLDSALDVFRAALTLERANGDRKGEAAALTMIGLVQGATGHADSALAHFRAALPLHRLVGNRQGEEITLYGVGSAHHELGQLDSALAYFRAALPLSRALVDRGSEALILYDMGRAYAETFQPDSALAYHRASLSVWRALGDRAREATTLDDIGRVYQSTGHPDSAFVYYRSALALVRGAGDQIEAATLNNIGALYSFEGISQPDSALTYLRAALRLLQALDDRRPVSGDRGRLATILDNIGKVYGGMGQSDSALTYLRAALPLARADGDRAGELRTLLNIGTIYHQVGPLDSMIAYTRATLPLLHAMGERLGEAGALTQLGAAYQLVGRRDSALVLYRAALPISRDVGDRRGEAHTLSDIGSFYAVVGRPDSALAYSRAALAILRAVGDRRQEATTLARIAAIFQSIGHPDSAIAAIDTSVALLAAVRMRAGSDASAVAFEEMERHVTDFWVLAWLARAADSSGAAAALAAAERGRAQGLRDLLARSTTASGSTPTDTRWARDTVPGADLAVEAALELAPLRRTRTAVLYYFVDSDTATTFSDGAPTTVSGSIVTTWLLSPTGELRVASQVGVKADSLAGLVTTLRAALGADGARTRMARGGDLEQELAAPGARDASRTRGVDDEASPEALARLRAATAALGALLLPDTLARTVPPGADLVIVPHGVLGLVPFAALPIAGDTLPLGARYALRYAPSLRALGAAESRVVDWTRAATRGATPNGRALVVGDPAMPVVAGVDGRRVPLRDLPAARLEGEAVAKRFGVTALTDRTATETSVRQALPTARLVHLATHGLAYGSEARVRDSYVALAPDSANDGLLTIGEILDAVPALAADLVVLSACQTGLGNLQRAEGTVGFQRALLAKGARSVLVSLWSVDDRATALLMRQFYAHWLGADGRPAGSKAEALRRAQADVRLTPGFASPRYWAAFQLVGAR